MMRARNFLIKSLYDSQDNFYTNMTSNHSSMKKYLKIGLVFLAMVTILGGFYFGRRPSRDPLFIENIHPGINYFRGSTTLPYRTVYHLLEIDLMTPGLELVSNDPVSPREYAAQTVQAFAEENETIVAVNGNFFYPFYSSTPFSYYPRVGELVEINGTAFNAGKMWKGPGGNKWPSLCISDDNVAEIKTNGICPAETYIGLAGNIQTLKDGEPVDFPNEDKLPRTVVGINETGDRMWVLTVDGRQWPYSAGSTHYFNQRLLKSVGAYNVLNLDGGGSSTLVIQQDGEQELFNAPYHTRIVMRQRPVANFLGFRISEE